MTGEDAIKIFNTVLLFGKCDCPKEEIEESLKMAIKALEQGPILDKIRAEIKSLSNANPSYWHSGDMVERDDVLEILDKYKAEQEET